MQHGLAGESHGFQRSPTYRSKADDERFHVGRVRADGRERRRRELSEELVCFQRPACCERRDDMQIVCRPRKNFTPLSSSMRGMDLALTTVFTRKARIIPRTSLSMLLVLLPLGASFKLGVQQATTPRPRGTRSRPVHGNTPRILEQSSALLGRLATDAFNQSMMRGDPDQPIRTKNFTFACTVTQTRDLSGPVAAYMTLPMEEYAIYDAELMSRIGGDCFELRLPVRGSTGGVDALQPALRVRVTPEPERARLKIDSIGASLYGLEPHNRSGAEGDGGGGKIQGAPAEAAGQTPAQQERVINGIEAGLRSADLGFNTSLSWRSGLHRSRSGERGNFTRLSSTVKVRLRITLPAPFTSVPRIVLQGAGGVVMRSVTALVVPQFMNLLEQDYNQWRNGSARLQGGGTLMQEIDVLTLSSNGSASDRGALAAGGGEEPFP